MRIVTFGNPNHPFMQAAVSSISAVSGIEHAGWVLSQDGRVDPNSPECRSYLEALRPDLFLAVGYGQILEDETLAIARVGSLNVHPSLLPKYRGLHAVYWALYEGETETGVTVHEMIANVDAGRILAQESLPLGPDDTMAEVYRRMMPLTASTVRGALTQVVGAGVIQGRPQEGEPSYRSTPWRDYDHQLADWSLAAPELVRRSHMAQGRMNLRAGTRRIFFESMSEAGTTTREPGTILRRRPHTLDVAAGEGTAVRAVLARPARAWAKLLRGRLWGHLAEPREMMSDLHPPRRPVVRDVVTPEVELHPDSLPRSEVGKASR